MDMDDRVRITKEVALGREPKKPDDEEMAALRKRLEAERTNIASAGYIMDIGYDWELPEPGEWGYWDPKGETK